MRTRFFIWVFLCFGIANLEAQAALQLRTHAGFLIAHNPTMADMYRHVVGAEASVLFKPPGNEESNRILQKPNWGAGVLVCNNGSKITGYNISPFVFFDCGISAYKPWQLRTKFATGFGYLTNKFNFDNNLANRAIGSHVNGLMQILFYMRKTNPKTSVDIGLGFTHHSNGNWNQPNLGINVPTVFLGYLIGQNNLTKKPQKPFPIPDLLNRKLEWNFSVRMGRRMVNIDDRRVFYPLILDLALQYPKSVTSNVRLGTKIYFDRTYLFRNFEPIPKGVSAGRFTEFSLFAGHEYRVGKIGFITDFGFYVYRPNRSKRMYYEAIGLRYYINKNWMIFQGLKAHLSSADYLEAGIVYSIQSKKTVKPGIVNSLKWIASGYKMEN